MRRKSSAPSFGRECLAWRKPSRSVEPKVLAQGNRLATHAHRRATSVWYFPLAGLLGLSRYTDHCLTSNSGVSLMVPAGASVRAPFSRAQCR
jgi:hypothetical protein